MRTEPKRQKFNTTPEQEAELARLRQVLDAPSIKDAILRAARVITLLAQEQGKGQTLYLRRADGEMTRLLIPELEKARDTEWLYLVARPHEWRRQLYVKGRKLLASTVWADMQTNGMSVEEATDNWDLPLEAVQEAVRYCESHLPLLRMEAEEERKRLASAGLVGGDQTVSLRLLLDEDTQAKRLVVLLREAKHDVQTVAEAGLTDQSDAAVLAHAHRENRLVLTRNCGDFQALHSTEPVHPGILGIFQYNDLAKDMTYADIVRVYCQSGGERMGIRA